MGQRREDESSEGIDRKAGLGLLLPSVPGARSDAFGGSHPSRVEVPTTRPFQPYRRKPDTFLGSQSGNSWLPGWDWVVGGKHSAY